MVLVRTSPQIKSLFYDAIWVFVWGLKKLSPTLSHSFCVPGLYRTKKYGYKENYFDPIRKAESKPRSIQQWKGHSQTTDEAG